MDLLHFTGQVWRPPYEAGAQLLQVTSGCTWHRCRFCSLYHGTRFRMSPLHEIENDLRVIVRYQPRAHRVFMTGGNPFALSYGRLLDILLMIRKYLPYCESVGCFARITDIAPKSIDELRRLRHCGLDGISIGVESGCDETLRKMDKGYTADDIINQCRKLQEAGLHYNIVYMCGLAGEGRCVDNARVTAGVFNALSPFTINIVSLTVFPDTVLYTDMQSGKFVEASEKERIDELITLIGNLGINVTLLGNTVSNTFPIVGYLPNDRVRLINELIHVQGSFKEKDMRAYRDRIKSL